MTGKTSSRAWLVAGALAACKGGASSSPQHLRVAAASDLTLAFGEAGNAFEKQGGAHVDFTFGSTGMLARQIEEGAPFDVFAAANVSFVDDAIASGACLADTKSLYARGRIVMYGAEPSGEAPALPKGIAELADPRFKKIALANPEHAPYGKAAREALVSAGIWTAVEPRLVYGENVQQALAYAQSGNADIAIVAQSLVATTPERYRPIDSALHGPLDQALVVCKGGRSGATSKDARAFVAFLASERGRDIMRRYGFVLPER